MKKLSSLFCVAFIILMIASFSGCATMGDVISVKQEGKEGITKSYPVNTDNAWKISITVLRWEGAEAIEEHRSEGYMLTSIGITAFSWGALAGVWIAPIDNQNSNVTVVTKRKMQTNIVTALSEETFHERFKQAVDIVNGGKELPIKPPE